MKSKLIENQPRTYAIILETGDEIATTLRQFAIDNGLSASSFKAIGALSDAKVGWLNWETKKYETSADIKEQVEVLSLIGDIALDGGKPTVHAHMVIGKRDGTAHGGHLEEAHVRPTLEIILTESPQHLQKRVDPESGLALIRP
ncbi:MAG TPA: PPC domain-containing DNA-binding protein [Bryobacteraceae bacterium]|nr:PPC domain-containing DNA-binding protein [Bryobacteraceae bacterium]